jgi:small subunit ribosomal protein S6
MEYELTVLIHPDLEADLEKSLKKIRTLITDNGGEVIKEDNWGKKRLAYPIRKENFALYVSFDVKLPADAPAKLSSTLNITDDALRYLLVKVDDRERARREASKKSAEKDGAEEE